MYVGSAASASAIGTRRPDVRGVEGAADFINAYPKGRKIKIERKRSKANLYIHKAETRDNDTVSPLLMLVCAV